MKSQVGVRTPRTSPRTWKHGLPAGFVASLLALVSLLTFTPALKAQVAYTFPAAGPVGGTPQVQAVPVSVASAGTLAGIHVFTLGTEHLDFTLATGCASGVSYSVGQTCLVSAQFLPFYPGLRQGAIVLLDTAGNVMATRLLNGIGTGPLAVMEAGVLSTTAGNGHLADGTLATSALGASIHEPLGVAVDGSGNIFYSDNGANLIRRVDPVTGNVATIAGTGAAGFSPDGTLALTAQLNAPSHLILDGAGNLFFADSANHAIREIVAATGRIVTVAGTGTMGYTGDASAATQATLSSPQDLSFDLTGNLYIADTGNHVIRVVNAATHLISTFAGTGLAGFSNEGGGASTAQFNAPWGVFAAIDGSVYVADFGNNRVRRISPARTVSTVAGDGSATFGGDAGPAALAQLNRPSSVVLDAAGDLYIADSENNCIRKVNGTTQKIVTIAGNGSGGYGGDGLDANGPLAAFNKPYAVTLDGAGNLLIADRIGLRVRAVSRAIASIQYQPIKVTNKSPAVSQNIENDGNAALAIASIVATANSAIDASTTTCSTTATLAVGSLCAVGARFKPSTVGSPVQGSITINSDSAGVPATILLSGDSLSIFPTTTTVTGSPNPAGLGTAVTFTATVSSPNSQPLTGTITFYDRTTMLGGVPQILNSAAGTASLTTSALALGSHSITAVYSGDSGDSTSTSTPAYLEVIKQGTTSVLSATPNPSAVYQDVTFTATVSPNNTGGTMPTGDVVFSSDGNPLPGGTITLTGGVATYTTNLLGQGSHRITATYAGDASNLSSDAAPYTQNINLAPATTTLASSNAAVNFTTPVTFTATVKGIPASTPTGTVAFMDGSAALGTGTLSPTGVATFTTATLAPGLHGITAVYQGDNDYATTSSASLAETIRQIVTGAVITSSANPAVAGATIALRVTITAAPTAANVPLTGTVTITQGTTVLGTGNVTAASSGPATATFAVSTASFTPGMQTIRAVYTGDAVYIASSDTLNLTISSATTTTVLSSTPSPVIATRPFTMTATVASNGATPTGTVTFTEGASVLGVARLNPAGIAQLATSNLAVGTHTFIATYSGDGNDRASSSNPLTMVVQSATTLVTLTPSQNPSNFAQPLGLTAQVTSNGGSPTGPVTFLDGATPLGTVNVTNGAALLSTATLTNGSHVLTAAYAGDSANSASVSQPLAETILQTITLTLASASPNPSIPRANVHLVATLTPLQGIQPTGSVVFMEGNTVLGTSPLAGTTATFDITSLAVGRHPLIAFYAGDATTQPMRSSAYLQTVNAAGTSIALTSSANPATFGSAVTFRASATSLAGAMTGTVLLQEAGVVLGQGALSNGVATISLSTLAPGFHTIVAAYQGDAENAPASSTALVQSIKSATATAISSSQNPLLTLAPVVLTATVSSVAGVVATGTIHFTQDGASAGSALLVNGAATLSLTTLSAQNHTFAAAYDGDDFNLPSASPPFVETVQLRPTTTALDSSATSLTGGQQITLTSILRWTGPITPTGTVTFLNGATLLGKSAVDAQGLATLTVLLSGTTATLTSVYAGDASYAPSTSPPTIVPIASAPNVAMSVTPNAISMQSGQHTSVTLSLASVGGFTDLFALGCNGLPNATTCTFAQDKVTLAASGVQNIKLTIDTGNPLMGGAQALNRTAASPALTLACLLPGGLLLLVVGFTQKRRRRTTGLILVLLSGAVLSAISGCASVQVNSTPAGSYTFQVTIVGQTGVTQFAPVTMNVTR